MNLQQNCTHNWATLAALLPQDRAETAFSTGAFVRPRALKNPDALLRLLLLYAWGDLSLRETAAAANESGVAYLSDVALLKRFRNAAEWAQSLLTSLLQARVPPPVLPSLPYRIQIVDGSFISVPGSCQVDYRLHAQYGLLSQRFEALTLTTVKEGETLKNYAVAPGDLFLADRGYGNSAGIAHVHKSGGQILVRFAWSNLPLQTRDGEPFNLIMALSSLPDGQNGDWEVQTVPTKETPATCGRVVALKKIKRIPTKPFARRGKRLARKVIRYKRRP